MTLSPKLPAALDDAALATPFVFVDRARVERNVRETADLAAARGIALRPHVKTHKSAEIAERQLAAGAIGLTVAKLTEAEALVAAGVRTSYMIAQPFAGAGLAHAAARLAQVDGVELLCCVDSVELARSTLAEAGAATQPLGVVLIVDTGYGRLGVAPDSAVRMAEALAATEGLNFRGVRSYAGELYSGPDEAQARAICTADLETVASVSAALADAGVEHDVVSIGNSPQSRLLPTALPRQITELRAGNYVFGDRMQVDLGDDTERWALFVVSSVVSSTGAGHAILDAGLKTLSSTGAPRSTGFGHVVDHPELELDAAWEECSRLVRTDGEPIGVQVGDRVRVVPNHACEVPNLTDALLAGEDGRAVEVWSPVARGRVW